ncbi:hypothetical protein Peur_002509 [Populus x canadensis]
MTGSSSHQIRNICVFDGSSPRKENEFLESANHLGQVSIMSDRLNTMFKHADVFIALPAVEHKFLTSSARQIIISTDTAEQLIDQLQTFIPIIDPSMSHINWSTQESRKKLRLDLSLCL